MAGEFKDGKFIPGKNLNPPSSVAFPNATPSENIVYSGYVPGTGTFQVMVGKGQYPPLPPPYRRRPIFVEAQDLLTEPSEALELCGALHCLTFEWA